VKLSEFRKKLKEGEAAPTSSRTDSDAKRFVPTADGLFTGVDLGFAESERSGYVTMRRETDGRRLLVAEGPIHLLHHYKGPHAVAPDVLKDEQIYRLRTGDYTPHPLGPSLGERYQSDALGGFLKRHELTWAESGPEPDELARIMDYRASGPGGRVEKPYATPDESRGVLVVRTEQVADYLIFCDNAFRKPMLCRYYGAGLDGTAMVVYVKGDSSASLQVGSAFAFYPAETAPCGMCLETGIVPDESGTGIVFPKSARPGSECPYCLGLTRIWRSAPCRRTDSTKRDVSTFAEANPSKWAVKLGL